MAHPNGAVVPVDEPAVTAARADHLAAKGIVVHAAYGHVAYGHVAYGHAGAGHAYAAVPAVAHAGYGGPLNLNTHLVAHPNGAVVPADEPAVVAARADHFAAQGVVAHAAYSHAGVAHVGYGGPHLVAHPNGAVVPADEPAVAAARAKHLAALARGH